MSYHIVDTFTPVPFHGNPTAVVLFDKADYNNVTNELKQKLALEFNLSATCFLTPIDTDDFQTAKKFALQWFNPDEEIKLCGHGTLAASHVLHKLGNPNEAFEFETNFGHLKTQVGKHDFLKISFPAVKIYSLKSHKKELTDKLEEIEDTNDIGKRIAELLPSNIQVNQLVYSPQLKYILIALDQGTSHDELMSLKLPREKVLEIDPDRSFVRGIIITSHFVPSDNASVKSFLAIAPEPDYIIRFFEPWIRINEDSATGSAQLVAAPFWATVYNRFEHLRVHQYHPKRSSELRIDSINDKTVEISGQCVTMFSGNLALDRIFK